MAITVNCPHCSAHLTTDDSKAGLRAKCPKCGGVIQIPQLPPAADDLVLEAELDDPRAFGDDELALEPPPPLVGDAGARKPCPICGEMIAAAAVKCRFCGEVLDKSMRGVFGGGGAGDPGWKSVRSGASIMYNCITVIFATLVLLVIGGMIIGATAAGRGRLDQEPPPALLIIIGIGGLIMLGAGIGVIIGQAKCAAAPESSGAKGFAVGSIVCMCSYILLSFVGGATQSPAVNALGALLSMIGSVLFILFIRRAAEALGDQSLSSSAGQYLIFCVVAFVGAIVLGFVAGASQAPALLILLGLGGLVCAIVAFLWYMRLLKGLIRAIDGPGRMG